MATVHNWLESLTFGEWYQLPANVTPESLDYETRGNSRYQNLRGAGIRWAVPHKRGQWFRLVCPCCNR
jgi:hypothetical protein